MNFDRLPHFAILLLTVTSCSDNVVTHLLPPDSKYYNYYNLKNISLAAQHPVFL